VNNISIFKGTNEKVHLYLAYKAKIRIVQMHYSQDLLHQMFIIWERIFLFIYLFIYLKMSLKNFFYSLQRFISFVTSVTGTMYVTKYPINKLILYTELCSKSSGIKHW